MSDSKPEEKSSVPDKKEEVKEEKKEESERKLVSYTRPKTYKKRVKEIKTEPIVVTKKRTNVLKSKEESDDEDSWSLSESSESEEDKPKSKGKKKSHKQRPTFASRLYDTLLDYVVQLSIPLVILGAGSLWKLTQQDKKKEEPIVTAQSTQNMNDTWGSVSDPFRS